jgi:hypothetical protein
LRNSAMQPVWRCTIVVTKGSTNDPVGRKSYYVAVLPPGEMEIPFDMYLPPEIYITRPIEEKIVLDEIGNSWGRRASVECVFYDSMSRKWHRDTDGRLQELPVDQS